MTYYSLSALLNFISCGLLGGYVFLANRKHTLNIVYSLFCLTVSIWGLGYFLWQISDNYSDALFWVRVLIAAANFIPTTFFHFIYELLRIKNNKQNFLLKICYLFSCILFVFSFTSYSIKDLRPLLGFKFWPQPGFIIHIHLIMFLLVVIYAHYLLFRRIIISKGAEKNQLIYVFIATLFGYSGGVTNYFLWYDIPIPPIGNIFVFVYAGIIAYAIVRHRLMDIDIVIKKGTVYTILTTFLTGIYLSTVFLLGQLLPQTFKQSSNFSFNLVLTNLFAALLVAFIFQPLKNKIQQLVDRIFFKNKYEYQKTLKQISKDLTSVFQLDKIIDFLIVPLQNCLKPQYVFLALGEKDNGFKIVASRHYQDINPPISPFFKGGVKGDLISSDKELQIPLISKGRTIGILGLGDKLSGDLYTEEDIELLETIGNQTAVALENYKLHEEILQREKDILQAQKLATIGTLTSAITHEIYSPLAAMRVYISSLEEEIKDKNLKQKAQIISHQIEELSSIAQKTLLLAKTKGISYKTCDIKRIINDALEYLEIDARKNRVKISCDLDSIPQVYGDEDQLRQVFLNLSLNAIQAMPDGGKLKITAVKGNNFTSSPLGGEPACRTGRDRGEGASEIFSEKVRSNILAEITIEDTGCGISEDKIAKIFEPFHTNKENGTGLGLFVVKKIIESHQGTIEVKSEVGKGSIFKIILPTCHSEPT